jgi:hypothetical protein
MLAVESRQDWGSPARRLPLLLALLLLVPSRFASAGEVQFGPFDIQTVFFIDKSDDHNRVEYGLRLDANCVPVGKTPVFLYWREFEPPPPVRVKKSGLLDQVGYGIAEQRLVQQSAEGTVLFMELKQVHRPILVSIHKDASGRCTALPRMTIAGVPEVELLSAHVSLAGFLRVAHIDLFGRDSATGAVITERLRP